MKANLRRWALVTVMAVLGSTVYPAAVLADTPPAKPAKSNTPIAAAVQSFSSETVRTIPRNAKARAQTASGSSFFQTRKGAVAIGLMAAGAGLTVWSINHDRKPVKSPVR